MVKKISWYLASTRDLWWNEEVVKDILDGNVAKNWHTILQYAFLIDSRAVSWSSKQQKIIALSTTKSRYVAIMHAAKKAI